MRYRLKKHLWQMAHDSECDKHRGGEAGERRHGKGGKGLGRRGGGRMFAQGDMPLVLLSLIAETPCHGYELIKAIEKRFNGQYAPSPGSVYPTLTLLEETGQVHSSITEGSKRLYQITPVGSDYLSANAAAANSALLRMDMAARALSNEAPPEAIYNAMHTLKAALSFHPGDWSEQETQRVKQLIETAAEAITRRPDHAQ